MQLAAPIKRRRGKEQYQFTQVVPTYFSAYAMSMRDVRPSAMLVNCDHSTTIKGNTVCIQRLACRAISASAEFPRDISRDPPLSLRRRRVNVRVKLSEELAAVGHKCSRV